MILTQPWRMINNESLGSPWRKRMSPFSSEGMVICLAIFAKTLLGAPLKSGCLARCLLSLVSPDGVFETGFRFLKNVNFLLIILLLPVYSAKASP